MSLPGSQITSTDTPGSCKDESRSSALYCPTALYASLITSILSAYFEVILSMKVLCYGACSTSTRSNPLWSLGSGEVLPSLNPTEATKLGAERGASAPRIEVNSTS